MFHRGGVGGGLGQAHPWGDDAVQGGGGWGEAWRGAASAHAHAPLGVAAAALPVCWDGFNDELPAMPAATLTLASMPAMSQRKGSTQVRKP